MKQDLLKDNPHIPAAVAVLELSAGNRGMTYEKLISAAQYKALNNIMTQRQVRYIRKGSGEEVSLILADKDLRSGKSLAVYAYQAKHDGQIRFAACALDTFHYDFEPVQDGE